MKKVLEQLYYGHINPCEDILPSNEDYREVAKAAGILEDKFMEKLSDEEKKEYINMTDERNAVFAMDIAENFVEGFKLGARVVIECLK